MKNLTKMVPPLSVGGLLMFAGLAIHGQRANSGILLLRNRIADSQKRDKFLKRDRERLAQTLAEGKTDVSVVIAALPGSNRLLISKLTKLGGQVRYRADDVDYVSAKIPVESVDKITSLEEVQAINVDGATFCNTSNSSFDETIKTNARLQFSKRHTPEKIASPSRRTPAENPYVPTRDIGAPQFVANHPAFDGRGVTIAIFEGGIADILNPQLESATTLDGKPTRKLLDVLDAYDPVDDANYKVKMTDEVLSVKNQFIKNGITYTTPADAQYQFGFFNEGDFSSPQIMSDINHDDNPPGSSRLFAVIWDKHANLLWIDTNQDHNFANEKAMTDYSLKYDVGVFGKDDPKTPVRESVAFVVKADTTNQFVRILPLIFDHASLTTNVAMGRSFFESNANGVAPGAQFLSVMKPYTYRGMIEGMILAMRDPRVDIVSVQLTSIERLNDGNSAISIIWDRLVEKYKKPIFVGASNLGPGINTIAEITSGNRVISVGGFVNRDTLWSVFKVIADKDDYVINLSSRGPREDGGFKPDIIAPAAGVVSSSPALKKIIVAIKPPYALPHGYYTGAGTSMATPMASGAAALLISAAKQSGIKWDADRLRFALKSSARRLPGYPVNSQGSGLIQIAAAWEALKKVPKPVEIISQAPVRNVLSRYLKEPNGGEGLYEREGWKVGQSGLREIRFTRSSGESRPVTYMVRWVGNDGTFSSGRSITLPLNNAVVFPVAVKPKTSGAHTAILQLLDQGDGHVVHETMNTVIAAEQFSQSNDFTISRTGQLEHPGQQSYFLDVPAGAAAFKFDLEILNGSLRATFMTPAGALYGSFTPPVEANVPNEYRTSGTQNHTIANPEPGVWEVVIDNNDWMDARGVLSQEKGRFKFKASVFAVEIKAMAAPINSSSYGTTDLLAVSFSNRMASFGGSVKSGALGSAFADSPTLVVGGPMRVYDVDVMPGAESLNVRINSATDEAADLDLYLYKCSGSTCTLKAFSVRDGANETVSILNPDGGKWKVVIDPVAVPSGKTRCEYSEVFTHKVFGTLKTPQKENKKLNGATWQEKVAISIDSNPPAPRSLVGVLEVVSTAIDTIGYKWSGETGPNYSSEPRYKPIKRHVAFGTQLLTLKKDADAR